MREAGASDAAIKRYEEETHRLIGQKGVLEESSNTEKD